MSKQARDMPSRRYDQNNPRPRGNTGGVIGGVFLLVVLTIVAKGYQFIKKVRHDETGGGDGE
jgi:hypothetical protein